MADNWSSISDNKYQAEVINRRMGSVKNNKPVSEPESEKNSVTTGQVA